jgi:hypothetical protein
MLDPRLHTLFNLHQQHSSGSRNLSHPFISDDTVLYSAGPSPDFVLNTLQQSFLSVQQIFSAFNLFLNTSKTKVMWFGKKNASLPTGVITTSDLLRIRRAHYITTLDLCKGYWQVPLDKHSKAYTAFRMPMGLFLCKVMTFGLHGALATFQRLRDKVLQDCDDCCAAYLDDVVG